VKCRKSRAGPSAAIEIIGRRRVDDCRRGAGGGRLDSPTAIVTGDNVSRIGAMGAGQSSAPADVSIGRFDDFEWADCFAPGPTLIARPCEEVGRRATLLPRKRIGACEGARRAVRLDATTRQRDSRARPQ